MLFRSVGELKPSFAKGTYSYTARIPEGLQSVDIVASNVYCESMTYHKVEYGSVSFSNKRAEDSLTEQPAIFTTVTEKTVLSRNFTGSSDAVTLVSTSPGGDKKIYTVLLQRSAELTNAKLAKVTFADATFLIPFDPSPWTYRLNVAAAVSSTTLVATAADSRSTIKMNGVSVTSGVASEPIALSGGGNSISVEVTAPDGTTKLSYYFVVDRPTPLVLPRDSQLKSLVPSVGSLSPAFASGISDYSIALPFATSSMVFTPALNDPLATMQFRRNNASGELASSPFASGTATEAVALKVGANTVTFLVSAQDQTATTPYIVTITRAIDPATDASLSALAISSGSLSPTFASATTDYSVSLPYSVSSISLTPTVKEARATVTGMTRSYGNDGQVTNPIPLDVGSNTLRIEVTAPNGSSKMTYRVSVTRAPMISSDSTLSSLALSGGVLLWPDFGSVITDYRALVANDVSSITLTPTMNHDRATMTVNGSATASGWPQTTTLSVGSNTIPVIVTAQDGSSTTTYKVVVTREAPLSTDATLKSLGISSGSLSPTFAAATTSYAVSVADGVSSITLSPATNESHATVRVNGILVASSTAIALIGGPNTIPVIVTAQDGKATKTYTVTVSAPSGGASSITVSLPSAPSAGSLVFRNSGNTPITALTVTKGTAVAVSTSFSATYYGWYLDNDTASPLPSTAIGSCTIDPKNLALGRHSLLLTATSGGKSYSGRITIEVVTP